MNCMPELLRACLGEGPSAPMGAEPGSAGRTGTLVLSSHLPGAYLIVLRAPDSAAALGASDLCPLHRTTGLWCPLVLKYPGDSGGSYGDLWAAMSYNPFALALEAAVLPGGALVAPHPPRPAATARHRWGGILSKFALAVLRWYATCQACGSTSVLCLALRNLKQRTMHNADVIPDLCAPSCTDGLVCAVIQRSTTHMRSSWWGGWTMKRSGAPWKGRVTFWSRSQRGTGARDTSDTQYVKSVHLDCDGDALLIKVDQVRGTACHTGGAALPGRR